VSESPAEAPGAELPQPSAEQLVEELRKAKVSDLLVHTSSMLASIAYGKLAPDLRDLDQARLAIDALKALGPLLDEQPRRDIEQVVANLQLAYASAAAGQATNAP
jgi:ribosomal protein L12E/L44/L45/RPP1/RPP2